MRLFETNRKEAVESPTSRNNEAKMNIRKFYKPLVVEFHKCTCGIQVSNPHSTTRNIAQVTKTNATMAPRLH